MHVVHVIANNSSVPYLNWFTDRLKNYTGIKFSFIVLYPEKPEMMKEMELRGCECYWVEFDSDKRKSGMIKALFKLYKLFKKLNPDVVNAHLFDDSLPALLAARFAGVKRRVIRKQDTAYHWLYAPQWVWADRFNNNNATHIIAISEEAKKFVIEKEKALPSKVYMIHNGIPLDEFTRQDKETIESFKKKFELEGKIVLGTIARFIEWKGYKYIIEAARILAAKNINFKFLLIGEGEQKKEMQDLVDKYKLNEHIVFTGWVNRKDIPSLYGVMDLYVHAAIMEPFGFVVSEAMANGVPIVTTKTGAAADVLKHKETCYFAEDRSPQSLADGIEWMINNPELREKMKGEIKQLAEQNFDIDKMLEKHILLYKGDLKV
jgi:glycosyltransferase involved in cell wall biosynthesis